MRRNIAKTILITCLCVALAAMTAVCMAGCSGSSSDDKVQPWPTGGLLDMVPKGADTCLKTYENKDDAYVKFKGDEAKFKSYIDECSQMGFTVDTQLNGHNYDAFNSEGYRLHMVCFTSGDNAPFITVELDKPKTNSDLRWPTQGPATMLPNPNKEKGSISYDDSRDFYAYVGGMSREEYDAYVDKCMEAGFNVDYYKAQDGSFDAKDSNGNRLYLNYIGFQTMTVDLAVKDGRFSNGTSNSNSNSANNASSGNTSNAASNATNNSSNASAQNSSKKTSSEADSFVAQGKTALMSFLSAAESNGYAITNPKNNNGFVSATAKGSSTHSIKYFVEKQKVFNVKVFLGSGESPSDSGFQDCFVALCMALNPDASADEINAGLSDAIASPDSKFVESSMLFRYDTSSKSVHVSY